jgi:hypothetical protein
MTERGPRFVRRSGDSTGGRLKGKCWLSSTAQCEFSWSRRDLAIGTKITNLVLHTAKEIPDRERTSNLIYQKRERCLLFYGVI